jgi:hypothetical protein
VHATPESSSVWYKSLIYEYVKPLYNDLMINMMKWLNEYVEQYPQDNSDNAYTIMDNKVIDWFPHLAKEDDE